MSSNVSQWVVDRTAVTKLQMNVTAQTGAVIYMICKVPQI